MSSITTLNQTILNICARYIFQRGFFRKNIDNFTDLHNEKNSMEVLCKWNCFGYWNSCKRLPNFVKVAALSAAMSRGEALIKCPRILPTWFYGWRSLIIKLLSCFCIVFFSKARVSMPRQDSRS